MPSKNGSIFHELMFIHESMDHVSKNHRIVIWFSAANWFQNSSVLFLFTYIYVYWAQCGVLLMSTSHSTYCSIHSEMFSFFVCVGEDPFSANFIRKIRCVPISVQVHVNSMTRWLYLKLLLCNTITITLKSHEKYRHENGDEHFSFLIDGKFILIEFHT